MQQLTLCRTLEKFCLRSYLSLLFQGVSSEESQHQDKVCWSMGFSHMVAEQWVEFLRMLESHALSSMCKECSSFEPLKQRYDTLESLVCSVAQKIVEVVDQSQPLSKMFNPRECLIIGVGGSVLRTCSHSNRKPGDIDLGMIIKPRSPEYFQRKRPFVGNTILFEPIDLAAVRLLKEASKKAWIRCSGEIIEKLDLHPDFEPGIGGIAFVTPRATTLGSVDPLLFARPFGLFWIFNYEKYECLSVLSLDNLDWRRFKEHVQFKKHFP